MSERGPGELESIARTGIGRALLAAVLLLAAPVGLLAQAATVDCESKPGERRGRPTSTPSSAR